MTNEMYAANALFGGNRNPPATKSAKKTISTTQPCHVIGRPHPHPYRFAGNQYSASSCNGASFREKVSIHGIIPDFHRRDPSSAHCNHWCDRHQPGSWEHGNKASM